MTKILGAIEIDRRKPDAQESAWSRGERDRLTRQLREANAKAARSWDEGFAAAVDMVRRGACLEQLQAQMRGYPPTLPQVARARTQEFTDDTMVSVPVETWESDEKTEPYTVIPFEVP